MKRRPPANPTMPQIARMVQLRRAGLSCAGIAIVFRVDYGIDVNPGSVRAWTKRFGNQDDFPTRGAGVSKDNGNFSGAPA